MNAKETLMQLHKINEEIDIKRNLVEIYRNRAKGLKSPQYSSMPKNSSQNKDFVGKYIIKSEDLELEIKHLIERYYVLENQLLNIIMQLKKEYQIILIKRYIEYLPWWNIETILGYSRSYTYKLHKDALVSFSKKYIE